MDLVVRPLPIGDLGEDLEIVEHKGLGHPDTMCDAFAEAFGRSLARFYLERFGNLLHFNVDKALLVGGESRPEFSGGEVIAPIQVFLAGRATCDVRGIRIPVQDIAIEASKGWVRDHLHALDPDRHVIWKCLARGGSVDLVDLFGSAKHRKEPRLANDTSFGVGFAPASTLERVVLVAADRLRTLARSRPEVGEDVKIMGFRRNDRIRLTVACAFIGRYIAHRDEYALRRDEVAHAVASAAQDACGREVAVEINAADDISAGRVYLTVTGTSAEAGDDGEVGRGNRVNGLITPYRPMSLEAAAGKNPASHVGKLYNVAAHRIASAVVERISAVSEVQCFLLSRIGRPVDDPVIADVCVRTQGGEPIDVVRTHIEEIVREQVGSISALSDAILAGSVPVF